MISLGHEHESKIRADGERNYPNEACGILLGVEEDGDREIRQVLVIENVFEEGEKYHRFSLDPLELLRAEREADRNGLSVLGIYHSHPDHPAIPSAYDRKMAWPYYSYIIVQVNDGKSGLMTSWRLNEGGDEFSEEAICLES